MLIVLSIVLLLQSIKKQKNNALNTAKVCRWIINYKKLLIKSTKVLDFILIGISNKEKEELTGDENVKRVKTIKSLRKIEISDNIDKIWKSSYGAQISKTPDELRRNDWTPIINEIHGVLHPNEIKVKYYFENRHQENL